MYKCHHGRLVIDFYFQPFEHLQYFEKFVTPLFREKSETVICGLLIMGNWSTVYYSKIQ